MRSFVSFVLLIVLSISVSAQKISPDKLPYITHYETVYIDGGCSFFNEINIPLQEHKYQLIISAYNTAFIQGATKQILFRRKKRVKTNKGYIDYYKGKAGSFVLTINSITKIKGQGSIRSGTLKMITKNITSETRIHGKVYEIDSYNGYTERQIHPNRH